MRQKDFDAVKKYLVGAGVVLDAGVGDGRSMHLLKDCKEVYGIEIDEERANKARENTFYKSIVVGDLADMPFNNSLFDVVFCNEVLEHLTNPKKVFYEVKRVLKPGGYFIIIAPTFWFRRGPILWRLMKLFEMLTNNFTLRFINEKEYDNSPLDNAEELLYLTCPAEIRSILEEIGFKIIRQSRFRCVFVAQSHQEQSHKP